MTPIEYEWINSTDGLEQYCQQIQNSTNLFIDTEFIRTRTFYAQLGLIQLYDGKHLALVDAVSIEDFTPLTEIFKNETILKVLYAGGEDLDIFLRHLDAPKPYIDVQLMVAFLGGGLSFGFANAIEQYLEIKLDKSASRSDWLARPLSSVQCQYAAADVYYLAPLYDALLTDIKQTGWLNSILYESQLAITKRQKIVEPEKLYCKIRNSWQLAPQQLAILKAAVTWRYKLAKSKDRALNFVVREEALFKLATIAPTNKKELQQCGFTFKEIEYYGAKLLSFVSDAKALDPSLYPAVIAKPRDTLSDRDKLNQLKEKVNEIAEELKLEPSLLAPKKQLYKLLQREDETIDAYRQRVAQLELFQNWRMPLLKDPLIDLIQDSNI